MNHSERKALNEKSITTMRRGIERLKQSVSECSNQRDRKYLLRVTAQADRLLNQLIRDRGRLAKQMQEHEKLGLWFIRELRARLKGNAGDGKKDAENH